MKRWYIITIMVAALFLSLGGCVPETPKELTIVQSEMVVEGAYSVVSGEAKLSEAAPMWESGKVTISFLDENGNVIREDTEWGFVDPSQSWSFEACCLVDYERTIASTYRITADKWMEILTSEMVLETKDAWSVVKGIARNDGDRPLHWVTLVVKFYDQEGALLGQSSTLTEHLSPGERWRFEVSSRWEFEGLASSYEVLREAD